MLQFETLTISEISQRMGLDPSHPGVSRRRAGAQGAWPSAAAIPTHWRRNPITITDKGMELVNAVPVITGEDLTFQALQSFGVEPTTQLRVCCAG